MTTTHRIDRLGHRGDGIAPGPIYAPVTLPGETVSGELSGDRLSDIRIVEASPNRVAPPCTHFKSCGGCALQHANDKFVADWKTHMVHAALSAHSLEAPITAIHTSAPLSRRRATLSGRRTKKFAIVGLHARASGTIIDIPNCQLLHPDLIAAIPGLQAITAAAASRKGELSFAITRAHAGPDIAVSGGRDIDGKLQIELAALAEYYAIARLTWNGELIAQRDPPAQLFGSAIVTPPPGAFLQATEHGQAALLSAVTRAVGPARTIADLFAGCGTFALPLAQFGEVHGVESDAAMLHALDKGWRTATGLKKVSTEVRDLYRRPLMPDELNRYEAIVIDPPRAGAEAQFRELAKSTAAKIAAVSCNPVTFARDAAILCTAGYSIDWIEIIDQFRWSPHVELVAAISRR